MGLTNTNDISLKVGFDIDRFSSELAKTNGLLNKWSTSIQGQLTHAFSLTAGIYYLKQGITSVVSSLAEFEHSMSAVKAITGAASDELAKLKNNALQMAGAFRANDVAQFELEMAKMGFTSKQIEDMSQAVINLATATGEDLVKSGEIAGAVMNQFGLKATDMTKITDTMSGAINLSSMKLIDFGESIKYIGPTADQVGLSLEEVAAAMVIFAQSGIKGSMQGTGFKRILTDIALEGGVTKDKLEALGKATLNTTQAYDQFGRIAQGMAVTWSNSWDKYEATLKQIQNMNGVTAKQASEMMNNLIGDWKKLNAEWDRVIQGEGGGTITDFLRQLTQNLKDQLAVWNSADISVWQKIFGSREEYAEYLKFLDDAKAKSKQYADDMATLTGGPDKSLGFRANMATALKNNPPAQYNSLNQTGRNMPEIDSFKDYQKALDDVGASLQKVTDDHKEMVDAVGANYQANQALDDEWSNFHEEVGPEVQKVIDGLVNKYEIAKNKTVELGLTMRQMARQVTQVFNRMAIDVGMALGQAFAGGDLGKILLGSMGKLLIELGTMAIMISNVLEGIRIALTTLNPFVALGVGIAAVALGSYFASEAASIGGSISGGGGGQRLSPTAQQHDVNVNGQFTARGSDLVLVLNKQNYRNGINGG